MRLATVRFGDRETFGAVLAGSRLADLGLALPGIPTLRLALSELGLGEIEAAAGRAPVVALDTAAWRPVIPDPQQIFCVGANYHGSKSGNAPCGKLSRWPTITLRLAASQIGHEQAIRRSSSSASFDFEGELAVIIGRPGFRLTDDAALAVVAGYSMYDDVTARDWQMHSSQWAPGQSFFGTGALGPWMITADEVDLLTAMLTTTVNGVVMQRACLADMVHSVGSIVSYISQFTPLFAGDIVATGTPAGVGHARIPPSYLRHGDVIDVEVTGIGTLSNTVIDVL